MFTAYSLFIPYIAHENSASGQAYGMMAELCRLYAGYVKHEFQEESWTALK